MSWYSLIWSYVPGMIMLFEVNEKLDKQHVDLTYSLNRRMGFSMVATTALAWNYTASKKDAV